MVHEDQVVLALRYPVLAVAGRTRPCRVPRRRAVARPVYPWHNPVRSKASRTVQRALLRRGGGGSTLTRKRPFAGRRKGAANIAQVKKLKRIQAEVRSPRCALRNRTRMLKHRWEQSTLFSSLRPIKFPPAPLLRSVAGQDSGAWLRGLDNDAESEITRAPAAGRSSDYNPTECLRLHVRS